MTKLFTALAVLLDRLQALGETPTVNPGKKPWTVTPAPEKPAQVVGYFVASVVGGTALAVFWVTSITGQAGFIYANF